MNGDRRLSRRELLRRAPAIGIAGLTLPAILAACGREPEEAGGGGVTGPTGATAPSPTAIPTTDIEGTSIKVSTYGGFFEENFREMYGAFTDATGVSVESISQPTSEVWVTQLDQSVRAGTAPPADISMLSGVGIQRAIKGDILATYPLVSLTNTDNIADGYIRTDETGNVTGVGNVSWYITLVSNTDRVPESPDSWTAFWDPRWKNELALLRNAGNSFLIEITAATYFDGYDVLETQDGVVEVLTKLQEVKPNVKLWYRDEAQAQQQFNTGEVSLGQFYHDITTYAASQGEPLRSVFPTEGAILDSGFWAVTKTTENLAGCVAFIDYFCQPQIQAELARTLGTTPTAKRETMDLSDEEYEAVGGPGPDAALRPKYEIYDEWEDWIDQQWTEMILS
ncbi:MAG TPA: extracellular solute-binding protein [Actinomycetota bacterium]|nr:extracellular solute-binding protein [Actinomycetota bacterium]